jgi:aconitate hydratase
MAFDLDLVQKVYRELPGKVNAARQLLGRPLTQAEKILYGGHTSAEKTM